MNTSLSWIKAYVPDLDVTAQEYTDAMTLSGTKVEGYEKLDADLDKIVIGQIDVNPDSALGRANRKFADRFRIVEAMVRETGRPWSSFSLDMLDEFWKEAKKVPMAGN